MNHFIELIPSSIIFDNIDIQEQVSLIKGLQLLQTDEENAIKYMINYIFEIIPEAKTMSFKFDYIIQNDEIKTFIKE